jgi:hypothetical protein
MLHFKKQPRSKILNYTLFFAAVIIHYSVGVLFSYCFDLLVTGEFIEPTYMNAILFGCVAGLTGIIGWRIFFALHPNPPELKLTQYLLVIWLGHVIYAIAMFASYSKLQPAPIQASIPIC